MSELFDAKKAAHETIKAQFSKELVMINNLIKKACSEGLAEIKVRGCDCPYSVQCLLKNIGYKLDYYPHSQLYKVSWNATGVSLAENEKELMEIAKEAQVELLKVQ